GVANFFSPGPEPVRDSFLFQHQVHYPTPPNVVPTGPTMAQDVGVGTPGLFEGVGQDREVPEQSVLVDRPGQVEDRPVLPLDPGGLDGHRTEGEGTENLPKEVGLNTIFRGQGPSDG